MLLVSLLKHYRLDLEIKMETDTSNGVITGILLQKHGEHWYPVAYFLKIMIPAESHYTIHDKEMLAIVWVIEKWCPKLIRLQTEAPFDIFLDHKALEYFMTTKKLNSWQANWAETLSQFQFTIQYHPS